MEDDKIIAKRKTWRERTGARVGQVLNALKLTPNLVTIMRIMGVLGILGPLLAEGDLFIGALVYIVIILSDWFDGTLARYQKDKYQLTIMDEQTERGLPFARRLMIRGESHLGKELDPLSDKVLYFTVLILLGWNYVDESLLISSVLFGVILTLVRPYKRWKEIPDTGANWFGKKKVWVEVFVVSWLFLLPHDIPFSLWMTNSTLFVALFLGFLSLYKQVYEIVSYAPPSD